MNRCIMLPAEFIGFLLDVFDQLNTVFGVKLAFI